MSLSGASLAFWKVIVCLGEKDRHWVIITDSLEGKKVM